MFLSEEKIVLHCHDTRQKNKVHIYAVHSEVGKKIIRYKGTKLWNNLPDDIERITSSSLFKYKLVLHAAVFRTITA